MLRLGLLIFAAFYAEKCFGTEYNNNDNGLILNRFKRTPFQSRDYGPYEQPQSPFRPSQPGFWPPPPPFWPPPPQFWHENPREWGSNQQSSLDMFKQNSDLRGIGEDGNPPCDNCKGSGAVSNSQSDTGDAISVAISRSGKHKK